MTDTYQSAHTGQHHLCLLALAALLILVGGSAAGEVAQAPVAPVADADLAVFGRVLSTEGHWTTPDHLKIETAATVAVQEVLGGSAPGATLEVFVPGGTAGGITQVIAGAPVLSPGQEGYFLVRADGESRYRFVEGANGILPTLETTVSGERPVKRVPAERGPRAPLPVAPIPTPAASWRDERALAGSPVVTSVSPQIASAGTGTSVTISGSGFGTKASETSPADVGFLGWDGVYWASGRTYSSVNDHEILYPWTDTQVRVRVPTGISAEGYVDSASSGSKAIWVVTDDNLSSNPVPFAVSFGVTGDMWETARATFRVNNNCPGDTGGAAAIRRAASTWNNALPASFQLDCSGTTTSTGSGKDGENVIAWGANDEVVFWLDGNGTILEADIILETPDAGDWSWTSGVAGGSVYSIESQMLGNLGFCIGISPMYGTDPQGPSDAGKASCFWRWDEGGNMNLVTLHPADRAAAAYLYGGGSANPPLLAAAFTADRITGPAPLAIQFSDASIGGAKAWAWDFGDGSGSTVRDPSHTYASPGTYTVNLTVSAPGFPADTVMAIDRIRVDPPALTPVPGGTGVPTDTDNDLLYDDVNGNGRKDFADVVLFFNQLTWIAANEPESAFDYNGNSRVDFADVVALFNRL